MVPRHLCDDGFHLRGGTPLRGEGYLRGIPSHLRDDRQSPDDDLRGETLMMMAVT